MKQIRKDLKKYYHVDDLEDIRVIKDHQTSGCPGARGSLESNSSPGRSRGFGFLRFPTLEKSKAFVEQNFPTLHLGDDSSDGDGKAVKIRIQYSRERGERSRSDPTELEWLCTNVVAIRRFPVYR